MSITNKAQQERKTGIKSFLKSRCEWGRNNFTKTLKDW